MPRVPRSACFATILMIATISNGLAADWKLVWQDEFDQVQLDSAKWSLCERGSSDWDDTMSKDLRLIELKDGLLRLHGVANVDMKKDSSAFLTGGVTSRGKFQFHHGKLEARVRFKSAQGAWPAVWLLPTDKHWPAGGEIDIMEHLNFEDVVYQTIHTPYTIEAKKTQPDDNFRTTKIDKVEFNNYGIEWSTDRIDFLVNGKKSFTYKRDAGKGADQWPFQHPMYVILSMQIGGSWVGDANSKHFPAYMEVDWVRVYAHE